MTAVALSLAGLALVSVERSEAGARTARGVGFALLAALGFGAFFVGWTAPRTAESCGRSH